MKVCKAVTMNVFVCFLSCFGTTELRHPCVSFAATSTAASTAAAPTSSVSDGLPPMAPAMPQMNAWRQAQELTRKAEEEAMMAEKKSQEAYVWCVV